MGGTRERVMAFIKCTYRGKLQGESVNRTEALGFHSQQPLIYVS